jgi:tetratricopeptide (TPR) repeat protein
MKMLLLLLVFLQVSDGARSGNEAYNRGDFTAAESAFRQAIERNPDDARLHFNLGNALARQQKFDEAIQAYERFKSLSQSPQDRALADYNIGNMFGQQEEWGRAADQFRNALRQNPGDQEAKFNFEFANRNQQQQEEEQPSQDGDDQQEQDQDQQSEPQQDDSEGDQQENQQDQQSDQNDGDDGEPDQQPESQPQPGDMTQEDAERLLNALENQEQDLLRDFHKNQIPQNRRHAKDW